MNPSHPYRVAIIGCGNIAFTGHLPAVLKHPRFELRGLCDIRTEPMDAMFKTCRELRPGSETNVKLSSDYRALIAGHDIDACILALHPEYSVEVAATLLRKGIAILDEKPLAATLEDGVRLVQVVEQTQGVYQIGFCLRYGNLVRDVAQWIQPFGSPCLYQVSMYDEGLEQCQGEYGAMIRSILQHSSAMTHEGSHVIDWMSQLNPSPIHSVKASATKTLGEFAGPNLWICNFDYADGSTMQLNIGWLLRNQPASTLRIVGPGGWLELDLFQGVGQLAMGPQTRTIRTESLHQAWAAQLDAFAEAMDCGKAAVATVHDGLRALRATIACERSFADNRTINLNDGPL